MGKQDYLIGLIAALEPNEKRYFKLFASLQTGEKRYLRLFDALEGREKYDGKKLCKELGLKPAQLAADKHYLTQILRQSLQNYDCGISELNELRNNVEYVHALMHRRLFSFALDVIERTLARAWELNAFEVITQLLLLESTCLLNQGHMQATDRIMEQYYQAARSMEEIVVPTNLRGQARELEVRAAPREAFKGIIENPWVKGPVQQLSSLRAKCIYYGIYGHYYSACLDYVPLMALAREERELYLSNPEVKIINPVSYISNILSLASGEQDFEVRLQINSIIQKEVAGPALKLSNQRKDSLIWTTHLINIWSLRHLCRFEEALPLAAKIYALGATRQEYDRITIGFEYALLLLHTGDNSKAAGKIDELLMFKSDVRADMQPFIRILHIMLQLNMNNDALIPHVIKAARFWLKKHGSLNSEFALFTKYAGLISKAPDKKDAWKALLAEIEQNKLPEIVRLLQLDIWVRTKIGKMPAEIG